MCTHVGADHRDRGRLIRRAVAPGSDVIQKAEKKTWMVAIAPRIEPPDWARTGPRGQAMCAHQLHKRGAGTRFAAECKPAAVMPFHLHRCLFLQETGRPGRAAAVLRQYRYFSALMMMTGARSFVRLLIRGRRLACRPHYCQVRWEYKAEKWLGLIRVCR